MVEKDPLDVLFEKPEEVNRELLRDTLIPFVRMDEKGGIFPLREFYTQTNKIQLIILLLSRKALALKTGVDEAVVPSYMAKLIDMPEGSLRPTLRALADERLAEAQNGQYKISSRALSRCSDLINSRRDANLKGDLRVTDLRTNTRMSMAKLVDALLQQGQLDKGKTFREIFQMVVQQRPGTVYNSFYKVILDLVRQNTISRELQEGTWIYKKMKK